VKRSPRIKLLLVDDHPIVRDGIKSHLIAQPGLEVVGEASNGQEAVSQAARLKPDVILLDVSMPQMNGLEAIAQLHRKVPAARVIVLTMHDNREYIAQMVRSGARGYLLKDTSPAELVRAIHAVHAGEAFFSPAASRVLAEELAAVGAGEINAGDTASLSERERDVLVRIAEGQGNKQIAQRLGVGVRTIETHRERIMRKLDIHTVAGLTRFAIAQGMVRLQ